MKYDGSIESCIHFGRRSCESVSDSWCVVQNMKKVLIYAPEQKPVYKALERVVGTLFNTDQVEFGYDLEKVDQYGMVVDATGIGSKVHEPLDLDIPVERLTDPTTVVADLVKILENYK
tara:strand:+ start:1213 stop:1566 length:354 start_codon:yes stop_codon:yes gene_type:complete